MDTKRALTAIASVTFMACSGSSATTLDTPEGDASVATVDASQTTSSSQHPPPAQSGAPDAAASVDADAPSHAGDASVGLGGADGSATGSAADSGTHGGTGGGDPDTCLIGGVTYQDEDDNPANICQWCAPSQSTTAWSSITDGAACGTDEACFGGICTSNFPDCVIDGTAYAPNTASPTNACALCQPRQSETSWTNAPDGTACPGGSCFAGSCG